MLNHLDDHVLNVLKKVGIYGVERNRERLEKLLIIVELLSMGNI
jgi:hypothetical protein